MHDILNYMSKDPVYRRWEHNHLTFSMLYAYNENFILPFSHDEVVHGKRSMIDKMPGRRVAEGREPARALCLHVRAPRQEAAVHGQRVRASGSEWNHDDGLPWACVDEPPHAGVRRLVRDLNALYRARAGAAPGRLRAGRLRLDRLQRQREQRHLAASAARATAQRRRGRRLQLHAGRREPAIASACPTPGATAS